MIVDVGCGPGHVTRYVAGRGADAMGIDLSVEMAATARRRTGMAFAVADMCDLPVVAAALDGVVARYSIIHLERDDVPVTLRELRRVVRYGGHVLVVVHEGEGTVHVDDFRGRGVPMDATLFRRDELVAMLAASGFEAVLVRERAPLPHEYAATKLSVLARAVG